MRKALVTGASGFVGANLVRALIGDRVSVRALVRPGTALTSLDGLDLELSEADLLDGPGLERALQGCDACFHLAAAISSTDAGELHRVNVDGSRAVLEAAASAGCEVIVHASTMGTLGRPAGAPARETDSFLSPSASPYVRSKLRAEEVALEIAARGAPIRIAHLAAPVGPWDRHPTVTGRRILDVLAGREPHYPPGAVNHVAVKDAARGLVLAASRGKPGGRYLLAKEGGNLTRGEFIEHVVLAAGLRARRGNRSRRLISWFGWLGRLRGKGKAARGAMPESLACDPTWSVKELGLPQTPLDEAFREAVAWFRERGYAHEKF